MFDVFSYYAEIQIKKKTNDGVDMKHQNFKHQIPLNKSFISLWDYKITRKRAWGCDVNDVICFIFIIPFG